MGVVGRGRRVELYHAHNLLQNVYNIINSSIIYYNIIYLSNDIISNGLDYIKLILPMDLFILKIINYTYK